MDVKWPKWPFFNLKWPKNSENWKYPKSVPYLCWHYYKHGFGLFSLYLDDSGSTSIRLKKTAFFWKIGVFIIFARKAAEFLQFFTISQIFFVFIIIPSNTMISVRHNWNDISWVITQKVPKLAQFWPPNFLIKRKIH